MANSYWDPVNQEWKTKPTIGVDHAAPGEDKTVRALGQVTQWNGAWSIIGEIPAGEGALVASTVFHGMLILAFENGGIFTVRNGKLDRLTFAPVAPVGG